MQAAAMMTSTATIQEQVYRLMVQQPELRDSFARMVEWERAHPHQVPEGEWPRAGWEWHEVQVPPSTLNRLVIQRVLERRPESSRKSTYYRLCCIEATDAALLEMDSTDLMPKAEGASQVDVDNLFSLVVGQDRPKAILRLALRAIDPVHCLLAGPPGVAKTMLLEDIAKLPGGVMYAGSTTTKSGLVGLLFDVRPDYLVLDELDKMNDSDRDPLLNLMAGGQVMRLQHNSRETARLGTRVFAGANDPTRFKPALLSRFTKIPVPEYTPAEFVEVTTRVLRQRLNMAPEVSRFCATELQRRHVAQVRDALHVGSMAIGEMRRRLAAEGKSLPEGGPMTVDPYIVLDVLGLVFPGREGPDGAPAVMPARR